MRQWGYPVPFHRRAADDRDVAFDLREEVCKGRGCAVYKRFIREGTLNGDVGACWAQLDAGRAAGEVPNRLATQLIGSRPGEVDLMIILNDVVLISENEFCYDRAPLQVSICVKIRNVS